MKKVFLIRCLVFISCTFMIFSGGLCDSNPTEPKDEVCGEVIYWQREFNGDGYRAAYTGEANTVFYYEDVDGMPKDICSDEHLNVTYTVYAFNGKELPETWTIEAVSYYALRQRKITLYYNQGVGGYRAGESFGVKDAYPSVPGWLGLEIMISFPTLGDTQQDKELINAQIRRLVIQCDYNKYKAK